MLKRNEALIRLPGVGRFLITDGNSILMELESDCPLNDLSPFILSIAWAALSYQRGRNLLKGALVELNKKVWLISGISPVGSSTFALALQKYLGSTVISDEFCSYYHTEEGIMVDPGIPALKLWQNSLEYFDIDCENLCRIRAQLNKFWLSLPTNNFSLNSVINRSLKLAGIISLQEWRSDEVAPQGIQQIKGFKALKKTFYHGFHRVYLNGQDNEQQKFEEGLQLAQHCKLATFTFKRGMNSLRENCQHLQEQLIK
ncbi:hypothetical protein [Planctobacterium marinum]